MGFAWTLSRRALLRSCLVSLAAKTSAGSAPGSPLKAGFEAAESDPVRFTLRGFIPAARFERRYRMDATILLLGAPLFTRTSAGGAYASVEKSRDISSGPDASAVALQFAAGSSPARAHGLNRFGILREAVVTRAVQRQAGRADATEISFAGLMTRAREENFDQARKALASSPDGAECIVARGKTSASGIQTWIDPTEVGADRNWTNLGETLTAALRREPATPPRETAAGSGTTFLHAMHSAALCQEPVFQRQFTHAGKSYWLETRRHPQRPSQRPSDLTVELAGAIHDLNGARRAEFRTTYQVGDESGIPIRIEYRPRSFLRLTFEAELEATQPVIPTMFPSPEESA